VIIEGDSTRLKFFEDWSVVYVLLIQLTWV